jgi:flavin-dependent dehydrogenase
MTTLIAGGGLAGAAAACLLGPEATLVERETGPHDKVCGEFISWEAQDALARLGIDPAALGGAPIDHVRLVHDNTTVTAKLPGRGIGLSRRILDEALLTQAAKNGARILRGHTIRRLLPGGLNVDGIGPLTAQRTLLATGKHDLRNARRDRTPEPLIGLKMFYRLSPAQTAELAGHVEIILFPGGYAGLQPIEDNQANLCLLIDRPHFEAAGNTWSGLIARLTHTTPHLATRLDDATQLLPRPVAIARIPYGFVHAPGPADPPNLFRLGDQMGVIPSFSGDGMAIALHTAFAAANAPSAQAYHRAMRRTLRPQIGRAMLLHRLGQAHPQLLTLAAQALPAALPWIARLTRVPQPTRPYRHQIP